MKLGLAMVCVVLVGCSSTDEKIIYVERDSGVAQPAPRVEAQADAGLSEAGKDASSEASSTEDASKLEDAEAGLSDVWDSSDSPYKFCTVADIKRIGVNSMCGSCLAEFCMSKCDECLSNKECTDISKCVMGCAAPETGIPVGCALNCRNLSPYGAKFNLTIEKCAKYFCEDQCHMALY